MRAMELELYALAETVQCFCQKRAGHRLMQVAQPFRELLNLLPKKNEND